MARHVDHRPATPRDGSRGVSSTSRLCPGSLTRTWAPRDGLCGGWPSVTDLCGQAPAELAGLVPADVLTWDRVELASGVVEHTAAPAGAEPPGAFGACVGSAAGHPLLSAHAAGRRPALRLSEATEPSGLSRSDLYGDLLRPSGFSYGISIGIR